MDPQSTDKLKGFYDQLKNNPTIKGLPDDYGVFQTSLADTNKRRGFYDQLSKNPTIKGLPDYDRFSNSLFPQATIEPSNLDQPETSIEPVEETAKNLTETVNVAKNLISRDVTLPDVTNQAEPSSTGTDAGNMVKLAFEEQQSGRPDEIKESARQAISNVLLPDPVAKFESYAAQIDSLENELPSLVSKRDSLKQIIDVDTKMFESTEPTQDESQEYNTRIDEYNAINDQIASVKETYDSIIPQANNILGQLKESGYVYSKEQYRDHARRSREITTEISQISSEIQELNRRADMRGGMITGPAARPQGLDEKESKRRDELVQKRYKLNEEIAKMNVDMIGRKDLDVIADQQKRLLEAARQAQGTPFEEDYKQQAVALEKIYDQVGMDLHSFEQKERRMRAFQQALSSATAGASELPAGTLEAIAIASQAVDAYVNNKNKDLDEYATARAAEGIRNLSQSLFPTKPEYADNFWISAFPGAMASFASYIGLGVMTGGLGTVGQTAAITASAAGSGASQMYRQAKDAGLSNEDARIAAAWGTIPGAIQVFPIMRTLDRMNKASKGLLEPTLKAYAISGLKGGTEEMVLESLGQLGFNTIGKVLIDDDLNYWEGVAEGGAAGGLAGLITNFVLGRSAGIALRNNRAKAPLYLNALNDSMQSIQRVLDANPKSELAKEKLEEYNKIRNDIVSEHGEYLQNRLNTITEEVRKLETGDLTSTASASEYQTLLNEQRALQRALTGTSVGTQPRYTINGMGVSASEMREALKDPEFIQKSKDAEVDFTIENDDFMESEAQKALTKEEQTDGPSSEDVITESKPTDEAPVGEQQEQEETEAEPSGEGTPGESEVGETTETVEGVKGTPVEPEKPKVPVKEKPKTPKETKEEVKPAPEVIAPTDEGEAAPTFRKQKIKSIATDVDRFQNRDTEYSEETVTNIVEDHKAGRLELDNIPPILVWKDPADSKTYVVGGHSRLEAFKRLGVTDIQTQELVGLTEEQAKLRGREDNALGTSESVIEQSKLVREWRDSGMSKAELERKGKQLFKNNARLVTALSALNPNGKAIGSLRALEKNEGDDRTKAQNFAKYIGEVRLRNSQLTDSHETELYNYLLENDNTNTKSQRDFIGFVDRIVERNTTFGEFDSTKPLNIKGVKPLTTIETEYAQRIKEARSVLEKAQKTFNDKVAEVERRRSAGESLNEIAVESSLKKLRDEISSAQREVIKLETEKGKVKQGAESQGGLFGQESAPVQETKTTKDELIDDIKDFADEFGDKPNNAVVVSKQDDNLSTVEGALRREFGDKIKGRFLNKEQAQELQKEIESNYISDATQLVDRTKQDIRQNLFNYDNPIAQKTLNGVDIRIAQGLIRDKKQTYILYADGKIIGEFYSVDDIKKSIKYIEDNLVKELPEGTKTKTLTEPKPKTKSDQAKTKADKAKNELKDMLSDFAKEFGNDLNSGFNPKAIEASAKIIAKGTELGFRKFQQFGYFIIENLGKDTWNNIFKPFKASYMANIGVDNTFGEDLNVISKLTAEDIIKQYESEAQDGTQADSQEQPQGDPTVTEGTQDIRSEPVDGLSDIRIQRTSDGRQRVPVVEKEKEGQRPAIKYTDADTLPLPKARIDGTTYPFIDEHQIFGVNMALEAFDNKKSGFMLADGAGTGKTVQILTIADQLKKQGNSVLIVTQNQQVIDGSFASDSKELGIDTNDFKLTTYSQLGAGKIKGKYDVVIYDEAHNLKNADSLRSLAAMNMGEKFAVYATATPMDTNISAVYFMSKVTGMTPDQVYSKMGLKRVVRQKKDGSEYETIEAMQGFNLKDIPRRLLEIRSDMIENGVMIRREYPFFGEISETSINMSEDAKQQMSDIEDYWYEQMDGKFGIALGRIKGQYIMESNRVNELMKVDDTYNLIQRELKEGRNVVIIAETVNEIKSKALGESFPGFMQQIGEKLTKAGVTYAEVYGDGDKSAAVKSFQDGETRVVLATPQSGGTGINLDDAVGTAPRTLIMVTANFSGNQFQQIVGRVSRRNTKSPAKLTILMNDSSSDAHKRAKVADKLATLKAIQDGVIGEFSDFDNIADATDQVEADTKGLPEAPTGIQYVNISDTVFGVTGDTYPIKGQLKSMGGRWNGKNKAWTFDKKNVDAVTKAVDTLYNNNTDGFLAMAPSNKKPRIPEQAYTDSGENAMAVVEAGSPKTNTKIANNLKTRDPKKEPVINRQEITEYVIEKFKISVGFGRAKGLRNALGIYKWKPGKSIALKVAYDLNTLAHEVGHFVHHALFDMKTPSQFDAELYALGIPTSRPSYTKKQVIMEGQAEFFRYLMVAPDVAMRMAPEYYKAWVERLEYNQDLREPIEGLQSIYRRYLAMDPLERFEAHIAYDGNGITKRGPNEETVLQQFYRAMYDVRAPLKRVTKFFTGKDVAENISESASIIAQLSEGVPGMVMGWIEHGVRLNDGTKLSKGFNEILLENGIRTKQQIKEFDMYLLSRRAIEVYEQAKAGKRKLKSVSDEVDGLGPMGMSYKDSVVAFERLDSESFQKAAEEVYKWNDAVLEYVKSRRLISDEELAYLREMGKNYVPFNRVMEKSGVTSSKKKHLVDLENFAKRITGSGRRVKPAINSLLQNASKLASLAERNYAAIQLFEEIKKGDGGGVFADQVVTPLRPVQGQLQEIKSSLLEAFVENGMHPDLAEETVEQMDLETGFRVWRPVGHNKSNKEIMLRIDGKPYLWRVNDDVLYDALVYRSPQVTNVITRAMQLSKTAFRLGVVTSWNFISGVTQQDQFIAYVNSRYGYAPLRINKNGVSSDYLKGLWSIITKDEYYQMWLQSKGAISGIVDQTTVSVARTVTQLGETRSETLAKNILLPWRWLQGLEVFSSAFENATRVGEFRQGVDIEGASEEGFSRAALSSREIGGDYARGGHLSRQIGQFKAFYNAGMQGDLAIAQAIKKNPVGFTIKAFLGLTLPTLTLNFLMQNNIDYQEREEEREMYWLFPIGDPDTTTNWMRLRKPWKLGMYFGSVMPGVLQGEIFKSKDEFYKNLFPEKNDALMVLMDLVPNMILPFVETASNYNFFFDQSIDPYWEKDLEAYLRFDDRNNEVEKRLGKILNFSPRILRHLIRGYTGTMGVDITDSVGAFIDLIEESDKPAKPATKFGQNVPGLKPFIAPHLSASRSATFIEFRQIEQDIIRVNRSLNEIQDEKAKFEYEKKNIKLLSFSKLMNRSKSRVQKNRNEISKIYINPNLSSSEKRKLINELNNEQIKIAKDFVEVFNAN